MAKEWQRGLVSAAGQCPTHPGTGGFARSTSHALQKKRPTEEAGREAKGGRRCTLRLHRLALIAYLFSSAYYAAARRKLVIFSPAHKASMKSAQCCMISRRCVEYSARLYLARISSFGLCAKQASITSGFQWASLK